MLLQASTERGLPTILHDADQAIVDLYGAQTTKHLFVIDEAGFLRYQGAFDDITFRKREATVAYLHDAVEALRAGAKPEIAQSPPYGCVLVRYSPE
jgi:hypothetical protein